MLSVKNRTFSEQAGMISAANSSDENILSRITQSDAISLWALSTDHQQWLKETSFKDGDLSDIKNIYEISTKHLEELYKEKKLPLDKMLNREHHWNNFLAWIESEYLKKGKDFPASLIINIVNEITQNQLTGGFFSCKTPLEIQKGMMNQISEDMRLGFSPVAVESDSLLKGVAELKGVKIPQHEFFCQNALLTISPDNRRLATGINSYGMRVSVSHLKSDFSEHQTNANFAEMQTILGSYHEQLHFSDMNVDVTNSILLRRIFELADAKGFVALIPDSRHSKIRLGNNSQPLKELVTEAETMVVFAIKKLLPNAEKGTLLINHQTKFDSLTFNTVPIFTDALPGDHHPVRFSIQLNGEALKFAFYNVLNSKDGKFPFYTNAQITPKNVVLMNDIHTQVKRETIFALQNLKSRIFNKSI